LHEARVEMLDGIKVVEDIVAGFFENGNEH
jgi:hypothetical protein